MTPGEKRHIKLALQAASAAGFVPVSVFDGEEHQRGVTRIMTETEVINACDSVDDSFVHFRKLVAPMDPAGAKAWARVILGNAADGSEVIADNSVTPGFAEAMDKLMV